MRAKKSGGSSIGNRSPLHGLSSYSQLGIATFGGVAKAAPSEMHVHLNLFPDRIESCSYSDCFAINLT
jgi:hypothetical protein